jgi:hypothetical protein
LRERGAKRTGRESLRLQDGGDRAEGEEGEGIYIQYM